MVSWEKERNDGPKIACRTSHPARYSGCGCLELLLCVCMFMCLCRCVHMHIHMCGHVCMCVVCMCMCVLYVRANVYVYSCVWAYVLCLPICVVCYMHVFLCSYVHVCTHIRVCVPDAQNHPHAAPWDTSPALLIWDRSLFTWVSIFWK